MELQTMEYVIKGDWSSKNFPDLDSKNTLILVFAAPEFITNFGPIKELADRYPKSSMIGCSTAGEISGAKILDHSLSVAIMQFNKTPIKLASASLKSPDQSYNAGQEIARQLKQDDLRGIFVLSDGLGVNGSELVKGLNEGVEKNVVITGGLAGDGKDFKKTFTILNGIKMEESVVAVGFYGEKIKIGHASKGGWDIFGPERMITKSKGNILYELDGKPALALYKEYLGDRAAELPASGLLFPLAIHQDHAIEQENPDNKRLVRTILSVNEAEQSLTFAGDVPQGYKAQLMRANFDRLISSAGETAEIAMKRMLDNYQPSSSMLAVGISCVGRRLLLGERTDEETELLLQMLPKSAQQIGFYSYGEISPYTTGSCDLHNQTMTLTTLYEE